MARRLVSYFTILISFPFVTLILKDSTTSTLVRYLSHCLVVWGLPSIHDRRRSTINCYKECVTYVVWNGFPQVHRAWYNVGFAPELLHVEELAGGFKMIAMEYLGPPWQMLVLLDTETKEKARKAVRKALRKVHELRVFGSTNAGSVHGDVRDVNIMVRADGKGFHVRFVDFDWAGQESVSTYPPNMNHATIAWPEGVADGKPMLQIHDMDVLNSTPAIASKYDWRRHV
jgi:hypothetical protein